MPVPGPSASGDTHGLAPAGLAGHDAAMATTRRRGPTARALQVANVVLAAILTGHELGTLGVLHPVLQHLSYADEVAAEQLVARRLGVAMPPLMTATVVTGAAATAVLDGPERALVGAGTAAYATMLALTLAGNVPVNVRTLRWNVGADDPIEWRRLRKRWDRRHALRVGLDLGGLAAGTAASLRAPR
jgi:hypothetical protein